MQYAAQLYTLRSLPTAERCQSVADAGFDGVELVGLDPGPCDGVDVAAAHVGLDTLEASPTEAVERARAHGTNTLVVPFVDPDAVRPDAIDRTAERLDALAEAVETAGGRLLYHNHEFEFEFVRERAAGGDGASDRCSGDGSDTPFGRLADATTRLGFEVDVGWAAAAGVDPVSVVERFGDRIPLVHLKDVRLDPTASRGGHPVDLGEGDVDLAGVVDAARAAAVEWLVFEHDEPESPVRTVTNAARWLDIDSSDTR